VKRNRKAKKDLVGEHPKMISLVRLSSFSSPSLSLLFFSTVPRRAMVLEKLSAEDRQTLLTPLHSAGWTLVEGRDAIYKVLACSISVSCWLFSLAHSSFFLLFFLFLFLYLEGVQVC